jgi:hypothetical protein
LFEKVPALTFLGGNREYDLALGDQEDRVGELVVDEPKAAG